MSAPVRAAMAGRVGSRMGVHWRVAATVMMVMIPRVAPMVPPMSPVTLEHVVVPECPPEPTHTPPFFWDVHGKRIVKYVKDPVLAFEPRNTTFRPKVRGFGTRTSQIEPLLHWWPPDEVGPSFSPKGCGAFTGSSRSGVVMRR